MTSTSLSPLPSSSRMRCAWAPQDCELYIQYHDREWGVPVHNDRVHFEFLLLEGAQAGLSWLTILKRREGYRKAFADFDPQIVARYDEAKIEELLQNPSIVRHRQKVRSSVINARHFLEVQREFGSFDSYIWRFVGGQTIQNQWSASQSLPAKSPESCALSSDLMARGFRFVGPTIMYAYMQAVGMVNDHCIECFRHREVMPLKTVQTPIF